MYYLVHSTDGERNVMSNTENHRPFLIQIYFVVATLIGLILIVMSSVALAQLGLKTLLGVKDYPNFRSPTPVLEKYPGQAELQEEELTETQKVKLVEWEKEYDAWKMEEKAYDSEDQAKRREIATSLAMLIVGIPVFLIHAPYVFKKK